jgi:tetratricopeptide (TPR) repeat protein
LYRNLGQIKRASRFFEKCRRLAVASSERSSEANALGNLGVSYAILGDRERALEFHQRSFVLFDELGEVRQTSNKLK